MMTENIAFVVWTAFLFVLAIKIRHDAGCTHDAGSHTMRDHRTTRAFRRWRFRRARTAFPKRMNRNRAFRRSFFICGKSV